MKSIPQLIDSYMNVPQGMERNRAAAIVCRHLALESRDGSDTGRKFAEMARIIDDMSLRAKPDFPADPIAVATATFHAKQ